MKRLAVFAVLAVLAVVGGPAVTGGAQAADGNLNIFHADTPDYPGDTNPILVCVVGAGADIMEVGSEFEVEQAAGDLVVNVFENDAASCSDTPDRTITVPLAAGDLLGLVIGTDSLITFTYDESCMESGTGRIQLANGSSVPGPVDLYAVSQTDGTALLLAADTGPGTDITVPNVAVDTYDIKAYTPGDDPDDSPPVALYGGFELQEGFQVQVFLAGSTTNDNLVGLFTEEQGPFVCASEEPPVSTTTAQPTTTTIATAPGGAVPATPVSGTASYTG